MIRAGLLILSLLIASAPALAGTTADQVIDKVGVDPKLGSSIPRDLSFFDEQGRPIKLASLFRNKPVFMIPVYYRCPMLCSLILNGFLKTLNVLEFTAGKEFDIVTFSINPEETYELAAEKKKNYVTQYGRPEARRGWHFLTGEESSIRALTESLGFRYQYDPVSKEYAHASAVFLVTPQGKIANYFGGVDFSPTDLRLALVEAAKEKIGSFIDYVMLLCFHYDPTTGKYGFAIMNALRVGGVITVLILGLSVWRMLREERLTKVP